LRDYKDYLKSFKPGNKPGDYSYTDKKTFFSPKEIIFRSGGRAKVFNISPRAQAIFLSVLLIVCSWSFYSQHMYQRSGNVISSKNREIIETREAYIDLMSDFVTLARNISEMTESLDSKLNQGKDLEQYRYQVSVISDRVGQITEEKAWINLDRISEKISLNEALLQRDIATSERDELREQIVVMEDIIEQIKLAEIEVLERVAAVTTKEVAKIRSALAGINIPLKKKGMYFNALANKQVGGSGGPFIPINDTLKGRKINDKMAAIFEDVEKLEYYKEVLKHVPMGRPVWSFWVSSGYGTRIDPFTGQRAAHRGVDLSSRTGNRVRTRARGKVLRAGYVGAYGNLVEIDHGNGFKTRYAHLHRIHVKRGDYVEIDDIIGEVGSTGRSTGSHLHYEVHFRGRDVDPMPFIKTRI
jgi:murein DD-endopeptidase MepM/ murein hydrolase activator NlpD